MVKSETSGHPSYPMLLHSFFFLYRIFLSLTRLFLYKEICSDPKQMAGYGNKHSYPFSRLPPSNIFDRSLSRLFTNKLSIFPISFPTFHRPFKRIRELWVPDHLFLVIGLMKTRHQKKRVQTDDRQRCSIKQKQPADLRIQNPENKHGIEAG